MFELTREMVLAEPAGARLDSLVAEHVTGWKPLGLAKDFDGNPFPESVPAYSTDIAAAWEVFCAHKKKGWDIGWHNVCGVEAFFVTDGGEYQFTELARGETASLAICRAALLAVLRNLK